VLIVCEGRETEPNYFAQLKQEACVKKNFSVKVKRGKGGSRQQIAQFAVERKEHAADDYDEVWCVMDVEHPDGLNAAREAWKRLGANGIKAALSNPAIEVWFLAHFERTGAGFLNGDAVIARLNKCWNERFQTNYDKADERIYHRLANLTDQAIANAQWVRECHHSGANVIDANSSTEVDGLVGKLLGK
jgi:hypothetical protein